MGYRRALVDTLYRWGQVALQEGDAIQATELFEEGLAIAGELGHTFGQACSLLGLAGVAGLAGQDKRAARLFGAHEAVSERVESGMLGTFSERLQSNMSDFSRQVFGPLVAAVRQRLGEANFATAWAEGRRMTLEQALDYAHLAVTDA